MDRIGKVWKTIGIIAIIAVILLYWDSRSKKRYQDKEDTHGKLQYISDELGTIENYLYEYDGMDYYEMRETIYEVSKKAEELRGIVNDLADKFADREYE